MPRKADALRLPAHAQAGAVGAGKQTLFERTQGLPARVPLTRQNGYPSGSPNAAVLTWSTARLGRCSVVKPAICCRSSITSQRRDPTDQPPSCCTRQPRHQFRPARLQREAEILLNVFLCQLVVLLVVGSFFTTYSPFLISYTETRFLITYWSGPCQTTA